MPASLDTLVSRAEAWVRDDPDPETAAELTGLVRRGAEAELAERFAGRLEFGTAGLRGLIGAGPNRMNRAVVRQTTAGLARYLLRQQPDARTRGVVVGHDARRLSDAFAEDVACVLAAHGIPALALGRVPTPVAAFATARLGAAAGIVVTASHNPPEYNGYKVYWGNGAQIVPPHDAGIAREIDGVGPAREVALLTVAAARARGLVRDPGDEVGQAYAEALLALRRHPGGGTELRIVYTALHGVGAAVLLPLLARAGFRHVVSVPEQHEPDGGFPTVHFPNPEEPGALDLALALAERERADLVIANDPDADRLAVVARDRAGRLRALDGNQIGVLLGHYVLTETRPLPPRPLVVTTIVSSAQLGAIARALGARCEETLTGFKWIANRALELERSEGASFLLGYEEALGYGVGTPVRDKDGIGAALVLADLAGFCRARGQTLFDRLEEIQRRHGSFLSAQRSFTFPGAAGAQAMARLMDRFRAEPPAALCGLPVLRVSDYLRRVRREDGREHPLALPASNVLAFELDGGARVILRPSGTEPKLKYYFELREDPRAGEEPAAAAARGRARLEELIEATLACARARGQD